MLYAVNYSKQKGKIYKFLNVSENEYSDIIVIFYIYK